MGIPFSKLLPALLSYVREQDPGVQSNGIWIVTMHPDAYSSDERSLLEEVKATCRDENIPLSFAELRNFRMDGLGATD